MDSSTAEVKKILKSIRKQALFQVHWIDQLGASSESIYTISTNVLFTTLKKHSYYTNA